VRNRMPKLLIVLASAAGLAPAARLGATEVPAQTQLIALLRPPAARSDQGFSTTAPSTSRARPVVDETVARTSAPEGTAAAALALPFPSGSTALTPDAERILQALAQALNSPDLIRYRFRIEGHTDTAGEAPVNLALSERRAAKVREHLVDRLGVAAARLDAVGLGETQLLIPTPDATPEPRNRRVQVVNIGG